MERVEKVVSTRLASSTLGCPQLSWPEEVDKPYRELLRMGMRPAWSVGRVDDATRPRVCAPID